MKYLIIMGLIFAVIIAIIIYVYITYGGKPITEIPAWALMFFKK